MSSFEKLLVGSVVLAVAVTMGSCVRKPVGEKQLSATEPKEVEVTGSRIPRQVDQNAEHPSAPWEMEILRQNRLNQTGQLNTADALRQATPLVK